MRVLVAHDLRSYREVIAGAFERLRPHLAVLCIEPAELDSVIVRFDPHLVVCSRLTPAVQARAFAWVLLYPEGASRAVISIAGQQTNLAGIDLDQLLALLDQVEALVQMH